MICGRNKETWSASYPSNCWHDLNARCIFVLWKANVHFSTFRCTFYHFLHSGQIPVLWPTVLCTTFKAHCVILLHMTKAAFHTFWHSLPILALYHVLTQATEACAFIAVLFMEILGVITSFYTACHFYHLFFKWLVYCYTRLHKSWTPIHLDDRFLYGGA